MSCRRATMGLKIWPKNLMLASHTERQDERAGAGGGDATRRVYTVFTLLYLLIQDPLEKYGDLKLIISSVSVFVMLRNISTCMTLVAV